MKKSAIVCAVLAGTLGFSSLASAREWGEREHDRGDRGPRAEQRQERHERQDRRFDRGDDRAFHQGSRTGMQQPRYGYEAPRYAAPGYDHGYGQPIHGGHGQRFYRGGYLPHQYRSHAYYVNDWRAFNGLYAPPYGQQWVNVDGEFLLVALTTGLIANAILGSY